MPPGGRLCLPKEAGSTCRVGEAHVYGGKPSFPKKLGYAQLGDYVSLVVILLEDGVLLDWKTESSLNH